MTPAKQKRLATVERELRLIRKAIPDVLALKATTAQQAATIARLIGENDALRRNVKILEQHVESLKRPRIAA